MEVTDKEINEFEEIIRLIDNAQTEEAESKLIKFKGHKNIKFVLIRMLISHSQITRDEMVGKFAISLFERFKNKAPVDEMLYYDVANGYQTLYEIAVERASSAAYTEESILKNAIKYYNKAGNHAVVKTNMGNLFDYIGRPVEAIRLYDEALKIDSGFGMAMGNKALTLEHLASVTGYQNVYAIKAYQLYRMALEHESSLLEIGGEEAIKLFEGYAKRIYSAFKSEGNEDLLTQDLTHPEEENAQSSEFVKIYTDFCYTNELYLNLHLSDEYAPASVGDSLFPTIRTNKDIDERKYVDDIAFRFNEISESFMSARLSLVQSQVRTNDFDLISQQTSPINNLDSSVSNIYVGYLKMAFKEAYNVLDKIAVLTNHYLQLGNKENEIYFSNVWFVGGDSENGLNQKIVEERYLVGLYLLSQELKNSKQINLRNALTHRYTRIYMESAGTKGSYTFDELTESTIELLYLVKCAITYLSTFITRKEIQA